MTFSELFGIKDNKKEDGKVKDAKKDGVKKEGNNLIETAKSKVADASKSSESIKQNGQNNDKNVSEKKS